MNRSRSIAAVGTMSTLGLLLTASAQAVGGHGWTGGPDANTRTSGVGDTNADSTANAQHGGWGGVFRLHQATPSAATGRLTLAFRGDTAHTGLDNLSFASRDSLLVVEDAGDTLHEQRNALDSGYAINISQNRPRALRFLAEGRDPSATIDAALGDADTPGFDNDGDNEITGIHVSDGDPTTRGLLGTNVPALLTGWRAFWTQQHGDNVTYELIRAPHRP